MLKKNNRIRNNPAGTGTACSPWNRIGNPWTNGYRPAPPTLPVVQRVWPQAQLPPRDDSVMQRRKFLLIAIALYSPGTLIGDKLRYGMRKKFREVLNLKSPTLVSNLVGEGVFYYQQYTTFRRDVTNVYYHLLQRLEWYRNQTTSRFWQKATQTSNIKDKKAKKHILKTGIFFICYI